MKTIIAALLLFACTPSFAQYGNSRKIEESRTMHGRNHRGYENDRRFDHDRYDDYNMTSRERDVLIQRIRQEYAWKIRNVYDHRYMRASQKRREVRLLENQRDQRIREVNARYYHNRNRYNDRSRGRW